MSQDDLDLDWQPEPKKKKGTKRKASSEPDDSAKWKRLKRWDEELETPPKLPKSYQTHVEDLKLVAVFARDRATDTDAETQEAESEEENDSDEGEQQQQQQSKRKQKKPKQVRDIVIPKISQWYWARDPSKAEKYWRDMKALEKNAVNELKIVFGVASKQKLRDDARTDEKVARVWAPSVRKANEIFRDLGQPANAQQSQHGKVRELEHKLAAVQKELQFARDKALFESVWRKSQNTESKRSAKGSKKDSKKGAKGSKKGSKESKKAAPKKKTSKKSKKAKKSKKSKKAKADEVNGNNGDLGSYFEP